MEDAYTNPTTTLSHGSLFSGIGGFDLAAEWAGWQNKFFCDFDPFCQTILKHHFPYATPYSNIKAADFTPWYGKIDILSGGFPCQPFSQAGKRLGTDDSRYLWPEMLRAIREIRPRWVLGENVLGIVNWNTGMVFEQVCADLETQGYQVQPFVLPAAGVNAPHQRYRTWFVAHANGFRQKIVSAENQRSNNNPPVWPNFFSGITDARPQWTTTYTMRRISQDLQYQPESDGETNIRQETKMPKYGNLSVDWTDFPTQSPVCGGNDGLPSSLDGITFPKWRRESIKAYGNAIVPQVAFRIFTAINQYEAKENNCI